jgi:hypothetical protein
MGEGRLLQGKETVSLLHHDNEGTGAAGGHCNNIMRVDIDSPAAFASKSHSLRASLREKEGKLLSIIHKDKPLRLVDDNLEQPTTPVRECEKTVQSRLSVEDILDSKIHRKACFPGYEMQTLKNLQSDAVKRNSALDTLKTELVLKLKRIVELEVELETHNIHFTDYAKDMARLQSEAFFELEAGPIEVVRLDKPSVQGETMGQTAIQKYVMKLLNTIKSLERRLAEERLQSVVIQEEMKFKREELQSKLLVLERYRQRNECSDDTESTASCADIDFDGSLDGDIIYFLRRQVQSLNGKRILYREEADRLKQALQQHRLQMEAERCKLQSQIDCIRAERDVAVERIKSIGGSDDAVGSTQYAAIQKQIKDVYDEVAELETLCEAKDRRIDALQQFVTKLQCKSILESATPDSTFSALDCRLLQSGTATVDDEMIDQLFTVASSRTESKMEKLESQLEQTKMMLHQRDQQLSLERNLSNALARQVRSLTLKPTAKKTIGLFRFFGKKTKSERLTL